MYIRYHSSSWLQNIVTVSFRLCLSVRLVTMFDWEEGCTYRVWVSWARRCSKAHRYYAYCNKPENNLTRARDSSYTLPQQILETCNGPFKRQRLPSVNNDSCTLSGDLHCYKPQCVRLIYIIYKSFFCITISQVFVPSGISFVVKLESQHQFARECKNTNMKT